MKIQKFNENVEDRNIFRLSGDDWEGYYYDGKLIAEGHSVNTTELLNSLGYEVDGEYVEGEEIWEEFGFRCPATLDEVKLILSTKKYNL